MTAAVPSVAAAPAAVCTLQNMSPRLDVLGPLYKELQQQLVSNSNATQMP